MKYYPSSNYNKGNYAGVIEWSSHANLTKYQNQHWYMDSRASNHVTRVRAKLQWIEGNSSGHTVKIADNGVHQVGAAGSSIVKIVSSKIKLGNILYVRTLTHSLLLVGSLIDQGHIIVFTNLQCIILNNHKKQIILALGRRDPSNDLCRFTNKSLEAKVNSILLK